MRFKYFIILLLIILPLITIRFYTHFKTLPRLTEGQRILLSTTISTEPDITGKFQKFRISPKGINIYITTAKFPIYKYGEFIKIEGKIRENISDGRTFYSLLNPKITQSTKSHNPLSAVTLWIRYQAITVFEVYLSPVHSALLLGIVFGIKQSMPAEFFRILQDAGVVHVIAASGMNVSMVAGSFFFIFQKFFKRQTAIIFSLIGIILYVFIAGFEASIVRASIMAGITFSAGLIGRQKLPVYALFLTAVIMLFINPSWLFDVGFQLSFLATYGIVIGKPVLDDGIVGIKRLGVLGDDLTTTLAAQLATFPVLIINFGSVNILSILVNLLVLWTIPILMVIGGISIITGLIFTQIGSFLSILVIPLLIYFEIVVRWFDRFKMPLKLENSSWVLWVGYYLLLYAVIIFTGKKRKVVSDK